MENAGHDRAVGAVNGGHLQPRRVVLLIQPALIEEAGNVHNVPLANEGRQQAGLREVGDVGGVTGLDADADGTLELLAADVLHVNAGSLLEGDD